jgi:hypothetical protein
METNQRRRSTDADLASPYEVHRGAGQQPGDSTEETGRDADLEDREPGGRGIGDQTNRESDDAADESEHDRRYDREADGKWEGSRCPSRLAQRTMKSHHTRECGSTATGLASGGAARA